MDNKIDNIINNKFIYNKMKLFLKDKRRINPDLKKIKRLNKICIQKNKCQHNNKCIINKLCIISLHISKKKKVNRDSYFRINLDEIHGNFIWKKNKIVTLILKKVKSYLLYKHAGHNYFFYKKIIQNQHLLRFFLKLKILLPRTHKFLRKKIIFSKSSFLFNSTRTLKKKKNILFFFKNYFLYNTNKLLYRLLYNSILWRLYNKKIKKIIVPHYFKLRYKKRNYNKFITIIKKLKSILKRIQKKKKIFSNKIRSLLLFKNIFFNYNKLNLLFKLSINLKLKYIIWLSLIKINKYSLYFTNYKFIIKRRLLKVSQYIFKLNLIFINNRNIFIIKNTNKNLKLYSKFHKVLEKIRTLRYIKYLISKGTRKIHNQKNYFILDNKTIYNNNKMYRKKKNLYLKNTNLLFWGVQNNTKIINKSNLKNNFKNWFIFLELRLNNIVIRSNLINNFYFSNFCIIWNNILVNKNIINKYDFILNKWDIITIPFYHRFLIFILFRKRLKYNDSLYYKKWFLKKKKIIFKKEYGFADWKSKKFKYYTLYPPKNKKYRDWNKFPPKRLILLNYPKYIEVNYKLLIIILYTNNISIKNLTKPFNIATLKNKKNIINYFNLIINRRKKKKL